MTRSRLVLVAFLVLSLGVFTPGTAQAASITLDYVEEADGTAAQVWGGVTYWSSTAKQFDATMNLKDNACDGLGVRARFLITYRSGGQDWTSWKENGSGCGSVARYPDLNFTRSNNIHWVLVKVCTVYGDNNAECDLTDYIVYPY